MHQIINSFSPWFSRALPRNTFRFWCHVERRTLLYVLHVINSLTTRYCGHGSVISEKVIRFIVGSFYHKHKHLGKNQIVNHYEKMGFKRARVYLLMRNIGERGYMLRKYGSGGYNRIISPIKSMHLKKLVNQKIGISQGKLGQKFNVSQSTICNCQCYCRIW